MSGSAARDLGGKRAVVTGAASGIGRATAVRLAREGARVGVLDRDAAGGEDTVATIAADGGDAVFVACDVTDEQQVERATAAVGARWGGLDIVVANAAVQLFGQDDRVDRLALSVWQQTLAVNLTGVFLTCKHGVRQLLSSGGGSVVCIASPTGLVGIAPGFAAYSSSKAGVFGLVRVMAADLAADGIRVNAVVPGFTATPLVATILADDAARDSLVSATPLGRPGAPEEVAAMVAFLASADASYSTGAFFFTDGGITAV